MNIHVRGTFALRIEVHLAIDRGDTDLIGIHPLADQKRPVNLVQQRCVTGRLQSMMYRKAPFGVPVAGDPAVAPGTASFRLVIPPYR